MTAELFIEPCESRTLLSATHHHFHTGARALAAAATATPSAHALHVLHAYHVRHAVATIENETDDGANDPNGGPDGEDVTGGPQDGAQDGNDTGNHRDGGDDSTLCK